MGASSPRAAGPRVVASVEELLAGATDREPLPHADGKSGARLERVVIDGERHVVKHLDLSGDWTMRAVGDLGCNTLSLWRFGILDRLPGCINQPIVGVAHDPRVGPGGRGTTLLMRDVGDWIVSEGTAPLPLDQHLGFLDHMAEMHATFWGFEDTFGLTPPSNRYLELSIWTARTERALGSDAVVPGLIARGWGRLPDVAPAAAAIVVPLSEDPSPLVVALDRTPSTFVHGNWKFGNLGTDDRSRTVLFDWEASGRGAAAEELAWYLAINCDRLPQSKEAAIDAYRAALERDGIVTEQWWDAQLALTLLGAMVHFGWEKALGDNPDELAWWEGRVLEGARFLA